MINGINAYKCPNCGRVLLKYFDKVKANGGLFVKCRRCEIVDEEKQEV